MTIVTNLEYPPQVEFRQPTPGAERCSRIRRKQRTSALEDQVRDHGEVLDALADIARRQQQNLDTLTATQDSHTAILQQLADMQEQTQSILASHQELMASYQQSMAGLEERHAENSRQLARLMALLLELARPLRMDGRHRPERRQPGAAPGGDGGPPPQEPQQP